MVCTAWISHELAHIFIQSFVAHWSCFLKLLLKECEFTTSERTFSKLKVIKTYCLKTDLIITLSNKTVFLTLLVAEHTFQMTDSDEGSNACKKKYVMKITSHFLVECTTNWLSSFLTLMLSIKSDTLVLSATLGWPMLWRITTIY